jgi:hypothetical protein
MLLQGGMPRTAPTIIDPGDYQLGIGIYTNDATSTELAYQGTWSTSGKYKVGRLVFNSANLATALGSSASLTARLVIKTVRSGYDETYYDEEVTIKRRRIPSPETTVVTGEIAATVSFTRATYVPLSGCKGFILEDPDTGELCQVVYKGGALQPIPIQALP